MKISNYIKNIDIFGTYFNFTTFKSNKYKTTLGGLLSLTSLIVVLIFAILFGKDFFYKTNPKIILQKVVPNEYPEPIVLSNENLMLAWRIEDIDGLPVSFANKIYPIIHYYKYDRSKTANELSLIDEKILNFTKCDEPRNNIQNTLFASKFNPSEWYCIDWKGEKNISDYGFGGYWDGAYLDYFTLNLYICPDQKTYSAVGNNCTSLADIKSLLLADNPLYFSMIYPEFYFQANETDSNPLKVFYRNYFYSLNFNLQKTDRFYFKEIQLVDDQGWILEDAKKSSVFAKDEREFDFGLSLDQDYKEGTTSSFYQCNFYFSKNFDMYTRSFMKLQDLAAVIGGFLKFILIVFENVAIFFNLYDRNDSLYRHFFDFGDIEDGKYIKHI